MTIPRAGEARRRRNRAIGAAGVLLVFALWTVAASGQPEVILPSPAQTWVALRELVAEGAVVTELARTIGRAIGGVALALAIGIAWGVTAGSWSWFAALTRPLLFVLMAVPPVVLVVVGLVWFGPGSGATRLVVVLVALPLIVVATQEAVRNIDSDLLEMATVFKVPRSRRLSEIVVPAVASPVLAAASVTLGQALRVAVMAELLSATDGVGAEVALARTNLATADLLAWALVLVVLVLLAEELVLRPLTAHLLRWRGVSTTDRPIAQLI